ncbi:MAG: hypothetical protein K2N12_01705, partial [Helicobacter sp.]|nr:hypothetical protein [Helicobacter sp.]
QDTKIRAILDVDTFTFDPNTDDLYQFTVGNQQMFLATKLNQTMFVPVQTVRITKEKYGQTLCAFMGLYRTDGSYDSRVGINSAGGWFYLTQYPTTNIVVFDRSSWTKRKEDYKDVEHLSFRFIITKGGRAEIHRTVTEYGVTDYVATPKQIPLNTWVYIQGKQKGLTHTVGWKTADDSSVATKEFQRANIDLRVFPMRSAFMHEVYTNGIYLEDSDLLAPNAPAGQKPEEDIYFYEKVPDLDCTTYFYITTRIFPETSQPIAVREFFYQPLMEMFTLMDNYDALDKDMAQSPTKVFGLDTNLLVELLNATAGASEYFRYVPIKQGKLTLEYANVDVYADSNDDAVVFDLRNVPPAPAK